MSTPEQIEAAPAAAEPEARRAALAGYVAQHIAVGYRVESQSDYQVVLVRGRRPNHLLHLILSVLTLGLWLIVWICVGIFGGEKRRMLVVDENAVVTAVS